MKTDNSFFSYETFVRAVAWSTGSFVAMTTFYPLDIVRSRLQVEDKRKARNTWEVIREIVQEEGVEALYKGLDPVLKSVCISNFVYFYTFSGLRSLRRGREAETAGRDLLLAFLSGVVNVLTTSPLWVVSTRMKLEGVEDGRNKIYKGLLDGLIKIRREEGIAALWSGTVPSLILTANPAIQLMTYESLKRKVQALFPEMEIGSSSVFLMAVIAKTVATVVTYPLQLVQTKLRHGHNFKDVSYDAGMLTLLIYILRKQGFVGLFRGIEAKILQVFASALMLVVYEKIRTTVFRLMIFNSKKKFPDSI